MKTLRSYAGGASLLALLTLTLLLAPPAYAQSASASAGPDGSQYIACDPAEEAEGCSAATVGGGAEAISESASQGTSAVNDAMADPGRAASAPPGPVLSAETASPEAGKAEAGSEGQGLASIKELPETGGAPLLVLCAGVALVGCGLLVRRVPL